AARALEAHDSRAARAGTAELRVVETHDARGAASRGRELSTVSPDASGGKSAGARGFRGMEPAAGVPAPGARGVVSPLPDLIARAPPEDPRSPSPLPIAAARRAR